MLCSFKLYSHESLLLLVECFEISVRFWTLNVCRVYWHQAESETLMRVRFRPAYCLEVLRKIIKILSA